MLFAVLGVVGVLMLAFSIVLGLIVLVAAEAFFMIAYRRFARHSRSAG